MSNQKCEDEISAKSILHYITVKQGTQAKLIKSRQAGKSSQVKSHEDSPSSQVKSDEDSPTCLTNRPTTIQDKTRLMMKGNFQLDHNLGC